MHRAGLTTREAVFVIAFILVLAAVTLPVFVRMREAKAVEDCLSFHIKEAALAVQLYWCDYNDTLPSSAVVSHSPKWKERDFLIFATRRGSLPPRGGHSRTWVQITYHKMMNGDIMNCPSDPVDHENPDSPASFWWKTAVDKAWYGLGCARSYRKSEDYPRPEGTIILYEHQPFHLGGKGGLANGVQINVAFMDTHVKMISLTNATSGDPINCAANSDGEPMYFNYDNERPKGAGNPPPKEIPAEYVDPGRYSDVLP